MLPPEYLAELPDAILELYRKAEEEILADMARRISTYDYWIPAADWQNQKLLESGRTQDEILRILSDSTGKSRKELRKMMQDAAETALASDREIYQNAGLHAPTVQESALLREILNAGYKATNKTMQNLTRTTANTATRQFENALDRAWLKVQSGAFSTDAAVCSAVKELSRGGVGAITYPSGHTDTLEVAVRRAVVTGVNQTCAQLQIGLADELGCDLVETTAHAGARPEHAEWQGKVFSRSGKNKKYPPFSETGYGTGTGLCGWNCRHSFNPYFEGSSRTWTDEKLKELEVQKYEYNGRRMTEYEATQQQRAIERQIRRWKRENIAMNAAGLDTAESAAKVRQWQDVQKDFLRQTGLKRQYGREEILASKKSKAVVNLPKRGTVNTVLFDDNQFGRKVGKHAKDFDLTASTPEDRARMKAVIRDIVDNADETCPGEWRGQDSPVVFYIKGEDVVITKQDKSFVTVLKGGVENARVKKARGQKV